ncbi:HNH endonuclease signature motif containing protein [Flavobacterium sp. CFS9]
MRKFWTTEETEIMIQNYPDKPTIDLIELLPNRTVSGIAGQASKLGLHKSDAFMKSPMSGRISKDNDIGFDTRFKQNQPGWNKGLKQKDYMSPEKIENTKKTQFKKGSDPHNTQSIGYERLSKDGYIEVKVRHLKNGKSNNKNFEFKHRIVYEQNYGSIPKGMIVEFLDGDNRNFEPENLVLKTRKENLLQNSMCDTSIVKRFIGIKEPEAVNKIIEEMPNLVDLRRKLLIKKKRLNGRN